MVAMLPNDGLKFKVQALIQRYGWTLLTLDELTQRTYRHIEQYPEYTADQAIKAVYMHYLYSVCAGQYGVEKQEAGYAELNAMLLQQAIRRNFQPSDEICQFAMTRIFERIQACRNPFAFWEFANQQMLSALQDIRRKTRREQSWDALNEEAPAMIVALNLSEDENTAPMQVVLRREQQAWIMREMQDFLHKHPRSYNQVAALWLKFVTGLDDQCISQQLNTSIDHVYTLRNRAINKLRQNPQWQQIAQELGIRLEG